MNVGVELERETCLCLISEEYVVRNEAVHVADKDGTLSDPADELRQVASVTGRDALRTQEFTVISLRVLTILSSWYCKSTRSSDQEHQNCDDGLTSSPSGRLRTASNRSRKASIDVRNEST